MNQDISTQDFLTHKAIDVEGTHFYSFLYQKLKEILIRYSRIILKARKDRLIPKILRMWLKN